MFVECSMTSSMLLTFQVTAILQRTLLAQTLWSYNRHNNASNEYLGKLASQNSSYKSKEGTNYVFEMVGIEPTLATPSYYDPCLVVTGICFRLI